MRKISSASAIRIIAIQSVLLMLMREDPGLSLYAATFIGLFFLNYVLLSFSVFYCNVRLIQFNVYFNHHLHTFLSRKTYYISVGKIPVGDTQTIADRLPIGDTKH